MCGVTLKHSFGLDPDTVLRAWRNNQCSSESLMLSANIQQGINSPRRTLSKPPLDNRTDEDCRSILLNFINNAIRGQPCWQICFQNKTAHQKFPKTNNKNVHLNNLSANFKSFAETIDHLWSGHYNTVISSFYSPPRCLLRNILDFQK